MFYYCLVGLLIGRLDPGWDNPKPYTLNLLWHLVDEAAGNLVARSGAFHALRAQGLVAYRVEGFGCSSLELRCLGV